MIYLNTSDLTADSFQRFITDSTKDLPEVIDLNEAKAVGIVKTLLKGRYNIDEIFNQGAPVRDEVLVDIIVKITLYKIFGRNAARKVSSDIRDDYNDALKMLEKINAGKITLSLPLNTTTNSGADNSDMIWGNTKNKDNYI